eukprot:1142260-Pelagomonas_calceolata.AAC.14
MTESAAQCVGNEHRCSAVQGDCTAVQCNAVRSACEQAQHPACTASQRLMLTSLPMPFLQCKL